MKRVVSSVGVIVLMIALGWAGAVWQRDGHLPFMRTADPVPDARVTQPVQQAANPGAPAANRPAAGPPGGGPPGAGRPVTVNAVAAQARRIEDRVTAVGSLLAAQSVQIAAEIAGRITEVAVTDGARVTAGAPMFILDDDVIAAELAQARAELDLAQANLRRTRNLARDNFVSERSRDEALSNVNVLQARLQVVAARQSRTRIEAPFDGIAGLVAVSRGDYITPGATLVRLDDLSSLKVDLRLPERLFSRLRMGQPLRLTFDAWPARQFDARIETIDSQLDAGGRSLIVRGRIDNADGLLLPGMFARAELVLQAREQAVMVPEESLEATSEGQHVFVVRDGKAIRTPVTVGARQDGEVEVVAGVVAGEQVVTAGQIKLRGSGVPVAVVAPVGLQSQDSR